jgi:hypothetical protein
MADRDTFGPRLRCERERRGISLDTLAAATKVSVDLWEGLERNDFSRWPSGVFARGFVRDYARIVGLDPDEVVNEFCRLFPIGDRRASRMIEAHAQLIGHRPEIDHRVGGLPPKGERRAGMQKEVEPVRARRWVLAPRFVAAVIDVVCALLLAAAAAPVLGVGFWATASVVLVLSHIAGTVLLGVSIGSRVVGILRQRVPALFAVPDRRRVHA